ncbi:uncharacterized protein Haspin isoform X2 [Anabrus simplex]|uniref:uncharacterized protein Haspin isoform X2 n=1 Tax=Anabrus simplex TaxID=316456 RepID=UPI0035A332DC
MPQLVEKTYKPAVEGRKNRKRPFSKAILKQVGEGGERNMPTLFSALYSDNIKQIKATGGNKENSVKTRLRSWSRPKPLQPFGNSMVNRMNIIFEESEFELDSSFDMLRKGPSLQPVKYEAKPRRGFCDWQVKPSLSVVLQSPGLSSPGELADRLWEARKKPAKKTFKQRRKLITKNKKKDLSDSEEDEPLSALKDRSKPILTRRRVRERTRKGRVEPLVPPMYKDETESCEELSTDPCSNQLCASDDLFMSEEEKPVALYLNIKRTTQSPDDVKELPESVFMQARVFSEEAQGTHESRQSIEVHGITEQTRFCTGGQELRVSQARKSEEVPSSTNSGFVQNGLHTEGQESRVLQKGQSEEEVRRSTTSGLVQTNLCTEVQDSRVSRPSKSEDVPRLTETGFLQSRLSSKLQKTRLFAEDEEQGVNLENNCDTQDDKIIVISSESDGDSQSLRRQSRQLRVVLTPVRFNYSSGEEKETTGSDDMFYSSEVDVLDKEECNTTEDEKYSPKKLFRKDDDSALGNVSNSSDFIEKSPSPVSLWTDRTLLACRLLQKSVDTALYPRRKMRDRGQSRHTTSLGQRVTLSSEETTNDMNLRVVLEESESKQVQPAEIIGEVLKEGESKKIQPGEIMGEVLEEIESNQIEQVGALDSSRLSRRIRRRSRHVVSVAHRTLLRDWTANDMSLEQVLEKSESEQMHADDAVDSRQRSYSRRRSYRTVLPEQNSNNARSEQILDESESEDINPVSVSCLDMSLMHRSMSHRMVFPMSRTSVVEEKSLGFRDVFVNSTLSVLKDVSTVVSDDSRSSIGNDEVLDEVESVITARDVVLQRCRQTEPLPFSEAFPDRCLEKCKKIGEGVYGEVFSLERPNSVPSVLKIIPIEGELEVNGEPQKTYGEILSEIVIAMELSELRHRTDFYTTGFSELIRCWCVQGKYPSRLLSLWFEFDKEKGSENDAPDVFSDEQLFIVLELAHAGTDLESYVLNSAEQALAVFVQVTNSLAVAEGALEFEHRDLHWGNILLKRTAEKTSRFVLDGEEFHVPTKGLQVTIIDFTLSRMTYDGCSIYNDLAQDPSLFITQGDFQFEVYRLMKDTVQNDWQLFRPYTNVLWLRYVLEKMEKAVHYRRKNTKIHKSSLSELRRLKKGILDSACSIALMKSNLVSVF